MQTNVKGNTVSQSVPRATARGVLIEIALLSLLWIVAGSTEVWAQQFNSDNYLAMPHGMCTFLISTGTEYHGFVPSFSLFPKWEFFVGAFLYRERSDREMSGQYTTTLWVKRMIMEVKTKNGGWALAAGTGTFPGHTHPSPNDPVFRNVWFSPMISIPTLNGKLIWDLNPGVVLNTDYGNEEGNVQWGFQYSGRLTVYGLIPAFGIVGEVFGISGGAYVGPQYRVGIRWEHMPRIGGITASWSQAFDGSPSGGFELGILLYTPQFACFGGCDEEK